MRAPLLLALAACAPAGQLATECAIDGVGPVTSEKPVSCAALSANVAIARDGMIARGWIKDAAEFTALYSSVAITLFDRKCLTGNSIGLIPLPGCIYGEYLPAGPHQAPEIELNWDGFALAHELMHHYDATHGRAVLATPHQDWTSLGYYRFDDDFTRSAQGLDQ